MSHFLTETVGVSPSGDGNCDSNRRAIIISKPSAAPLPPCCVCGLNIRAGLRASLEPRAHCVSRADRVLSSLPISRRHQPLNHLCRSFLNPAPSAMISWVAQSPALMPRPWLRLPLLLYPLKATGSPSSASPPRPRRLERSLAQGTARGQPGDSGGNGPPLPSTPTDRKSLEKKQAQEIQTVSQTFYPEN